MIYQIDQYYTLPVRPGNPSDENFLIEVDGPDGPATVPLSKLDFQKDPSRPQPRRIECRVRAFDAQGLPVLSPAIASYVSELYSETFANGESFECTVTNVPADPTSEPYSVRDRNGIFFRIYERDAMLARGQHIRCKFKTLCGKRFDLVRADEKSKLPFMSPQELMESARVSAIGARMMAQLVEEPAFRNVRAEIDANKGQWPLTAATFVRDNLSEWFVALLSRRLNNLTHILLSDTKKVLLYLLEGSSYLNTASTEQRQAYQQMLTELVEAIDPYRRALELIEKRGENDFVEELFDKLQKSGFLYHPAKQFGTMMLIFRVFPAKVSDYLGRIFESIFTRDLSNWKRQPFRSAFVEQFQIYVRQMRREIDALPLAENRQQKQRLETIITALALEMLLSEPNEISELTRSLFYRYVSLLRPLNGEVLLSKSFLALLGAKLHDRLEYSMLREPMMMMTQATVMPSGDIFAMLPGTFHYSKGGVDFKINDKGICLSRSSDADLIAEGGVERVVPDGLMTWLRPQVFINGIKGLSGNKLRSLADHNTWWKQIEGALFENTPAPQHSDKPRQALKGESVWITIDGISEAHDNDPTFLCHIDHEGIIDSPGILKRSQIVLYNMRQPSELSFRTADGTGLGFYARIIDIDAEGNYVFSLFEQVNRYIQETMNFSQEYLAVITGSNPQGYSAISSDGIGLYLRDDSGLPRKFTPGTIVHFKLHSGNSQGSVVGYVTETPTTDLDHFDKTTAFTKLMNAIGDATSEQQPSSLLSDEIEEFISAESVREIIEIIRFHAIANTDLIKAYDYLRYGRLLALAIDDNVLADKLLTHASLLGQHQFFAANSRIDADELEKLRILLHKDPFLSMIFQRLEMVSWLGKPEKNANLFKTAGAPANELEGSIARLVLSFNMMQNQEDDDTIAASLKDRIMGKLNVNSETRHSTYYGRESKYLEFKTSLVYVATAPGEEMREDPAAQQAHILTRIAGMLNANGGTLYLGVNDDGYAVGLRDDFRYYERRKAKVGNRYFEIHNMSNYCVFLEHLVNMTFGETVARKVEISTDDKADKDVIVISIKESLTPVFYEKRLFVRQSGEVTKEYFDPKAVEEFMAEREMQRLEQAHKLSEMAAEEERRAKDAERQAQAQTAPAPAEQETAAAESSAAPEQPQGAKSAKNSKALATSAWRPNVLHSYEDNYNEPEGYLYFTGETQLTYSRNDLYLEDDADWRLSLTIPHELKDGYLVLGYANERVVCVPLAEIYERGENTPMNHSADYPLLFAAIAAKDDLLMVLAADSNNTVWRRALSIGNMEAAHITNKPRRITENVTSFTVGYEIVDSSVAANFSSCLDSNLSGRRFGETMRIKTNDERLQDKIARLVEECKPA